MEKRIGIAVGGSGGHLLPAEAVAKELRERYEIHFIGVGLDKSPYFNREGKSYVDIEGSNFSKGFLRGSKKIIHGFFQARRAIKERRIEHIIGFGSFHSLPVLLAAHSLKIPYTLFEPNIQPGKVNRFFSRHAKISLLFFPPTKKALSGRSILISYDLHEGRKKIDRESARKCFGLQPDLPTILIFGGSQGSSAIDQVAPKAISEASRELGVKIQVIHISRQAESVKSSYEEEGISASVSHFCQEMDSAWSAADFAICRAGAGALREQLIFEKPAILIPYPHAMEDHQQKNAAYMSQLIGGARTLDQNQLDSARLGQHIKELLKPGNQELREMEEALGLAKEMNSRPHFVEAWEKYI